LGFLILKFNYYQIEIDRQQQGHIDDLYKNLILIKNISQIEWERFNNIKKIVNIIDQFNHQMEYELKLTIANEIYQMSKRYNNLDIELICATITHETALTWNPAIVSPANAIGLMQIIAPTGCLLAKEEGIEFDKIETILFDPILNINLGCRYLSKLVGVYSLDGGLAAYNGGMKRAETWLRNGRAKGILREETDKYVPSILKIYQEFRRL
jgi:soluble lytic murein transglycosylase-like protein